MSSFRTMLLRARMLVWVMAGLGGLAAVLLLSANVVRDLRLLNSANSDNVQWTLSQTEVEFQEYQLALAQALQTKAPDLAPDLKELRRKFDVFYSRVTTLGNSSLYAFLREQPEFMVPLQSLEDFILSSAVVIDKDDATLIASLPILAQSASDARPNARKVSNSGLNFFATDSDRRRSNVAVTLTQLAGGVTFLLLAMLFLTSYLGYLNTQNTRRRAEAVQASKRMKVVTSTALDAVVVSDTDGRILDFNAAAEQIFGFAAEDAIGRKLGDVIVPDHMRSKHEAGMHRMRAGGERKVVGRGRITLEAKRANGEIFPVELAIQSAETEQGEIFIAFLRDISQRVQAEADLVKARDSALAGEKSKTDFLAMMSHEIRTPLNGLLGNLSLLSDTALSAQQLRYIKNMDTSGKLLLSHVSDVLDITKYDAGALRLRPAAMSIPALLQDIIDNQSGAAASNNTAIRWGWVGQPCDWIRSDRDRIQHILMNIIGNAVKFTRNGSVSVEAEVMGELAESPDLMITVKDTGIGMDAALKSQIFQDFVTGNASYDRAVGGTGLGLGIAQRFVKALGGTIEVHSEKGLGSTFCIRFPIEAVAAPNTAKPAKASGRSAKASHILLVDDNEINRVVAREMLTAAGHVVTEAHNGQVAVDLAFATAFDLILMDISMPVLDGRGATRAIRDGRGASAKTPIVALTANAMAEEQKAYLADGMNDILTKPLTREGLIRVVANQLRAGDPAVKPTAATQGVALAHIEELRESLGDDVLKTLMERFVTETDAAMATLQEDGADMPKTADLAHRIAGTAATMGAVGLREALIKLEQAARSQNAPRVKKAQAALPALWAKTRPHMQAFAKGSQEP